MNNKKNAYQLMIISKQNIVTNIYIFCCFKEQKNLSDIYIQTVKSFKTQYNTKSSYYCCCCSFFFDCCLHS